MAGRISGRIKRAITSSLGLFAVAAVLAATNAYTQRRDRQLAVGPQSNAQEEFFSSAVERPDIAAFYKRFTPTEKLLAARNLGRYDNPNMVRLAALWLVDFDAQARTELSAVLAKMAEKYPEVTAEQLGQTGGFQKLAVFAALRKWEAKTLPTVVHQLNVPERRANAVEYLASVGGRAGPMLTKKLDDDDREVRLAAADALGKIGYEPAAQKVRELYNGAEPADKSAYLASLANLGDVESESTFAKLLKSPTTSSPDRASTFLGLARIHTKSSIALLTTEVRRSTPDKRQILEALSLAGDGSLSQMLPLADQLEVAGGIQSAKADHVVLLCLRDPNLMVKAAELAIGRPRVAGELAVQLSQPNSDHNGKFVDMAVKALASTKEGRSAFYSNSLAKKYGGFMQRERSSGS